MELGNGRTADLAAFGIADGTAVMSAAIASATPPWGIHFCECHENVMYVLWSGSREPLRGAALQDSLSTWPGSSTRNSSTTIGRRTTQATASIIRTARLRTSCFWKSDSSQRTRAYLPT